MEKIHKECILPKGESFTENEYLGFSMKTDNAFFNYNDYNNDCTVILHLKDSTQHHPLKEHGWGGVFKLDESPYRGRMVLLFQIENIVTALHCLETFQHVISHPEQYGYEDNILRREAYLLR